MSYLLAVLLLTCGWVLAQAGSTTDQNSSSSNSQTTTQTDQNSNPANPPASTDTNANPQTPDQTNQAPSTSDQTTTDTGATKSGKKLPQTASPLPLLGLLGLGSLASGFAMRKRK